MPSESPLQRLRRIEAEERAAKESGRADTNDPGAPAKKTIKRGWLGSIFAALIVILLKGKWILLFLLTKFQVLFAAVKFGPMLTTFSTMGLSVWVYANYYGLPLAFGFVILILIHELGHGLAAKIMGLKVGAPVFIPFFGAMISLKEQPRSTWQECIVAFGGPFAGMAGGIVVFAAAHFTADPHWNALLFALAWITFLMNLFNLLPVFGLDGDRMTQPFRPWFWAPVCAVVILLLMIGAEHGDRAEPFLLFILILGAVKGARMWWRGRNAGKDRPPTRLVDRLTDRGPKYTEESTVDARHRYISAALFLFLTISLSLLAIWSNALRPAHS